MTTIRRRIQAAGKSLLHELFVGGQRIGVNILPTHFYSEIPNIPELRRKTNWRKPNSLVGVAGADLKSQVANLSAWLEPHLAALNDGSIYKAAIQANGSDGGYGEIEALVLHAFILTVQPKRIVQIGCGVSTAIMIGAARAAGYRPCITCLEPYPTQFLKEAQRSGDLTLIASPAQDVSPSVYEQLEGGDLLFVDSTHTVKPGSEVNLIILEVLPRLAPGVYVHFHDVYFPYDYQRRLLSDEIFFHCESTLLHAFLACNSRFRIEASLSMLHYGARDALRQLLPVYDPQREIDGLAEPGGRHFPSAIWMRTVD